MALHLLEARDKLAAVLAPIEDGDPPVLVSLVDAIEPPALMLGWGDPAVTEERSSCFRTGHLIVTAVGSRLVPGEGVAVPRGAHRLHAGAHVGRHRALGACERRRAP